MNDYLKAILFTALITISSCNEQKSERNDTSNKDKTATGVDVSKSNSTDKFLGDWRLHKSKKSGLPAGTIVSLNKKDGEYILSNDFSRKQGQEMVFTYDEKSNKLKANTIEGGKVELSIDKELNQLVMSIIGEGVRQEAARFIKKDN